MSSFGFEIVLHLNDFNTFTVTPPYSLQNLKDVVLEKFDLVIAELYYFNEEENEKVKLTAEDKYFDMFNYVSYTEKKEIVVYVESQDNKNKKKSANRKNSRAFKPIQKLEAEGVGRKKSYFDDDNNLNDFHDAENERDLRNLKQLDTLDEGYKYSKHSYNLKNQQRIYYIKEKKEMMKVHAEKVNAEKIKKEKDENTNENEIVEDESFGKKNKNRKGNKAK